MSLTKELEELYKKAMDEAKNQLDGIESEMEKEIQKVREKLAKLQESKKSYQQIYEGAANLLGIPIELEEETKLHGEEDKKEAVEIPGNEMEKQIEGNLDEAIESASEKPKEES